MEAIIQQHPLGKSKYHAVDNHILKTKTRQVNGWQFDFPIMRLGA